MGCADSKLWAEQDFVELWKVSNFDRLRDAFRFVETELCNAGKWRWSSTWYGDSVVAS